MYQEIVSSVYLASQKNNIKAKTQIVGYICGLGGRDVSREEILEIYKNKDFVSSEFVNVKKDNLGSFI